MQDLAGQQGPSVRWSVQETETEPRPFQGKKNPVPRDAGRDQGGDHHFSGWSTNVFSIWISSN